jgi:hypothetical protein
MLRVKRGRKIKRRGSGKRMLPRMPSIGAVPSLANAHCTGSSLWALRTKDQPSKGQFSDGLLEFLARFEGFLATGVVKQTDLDPYLDYWIKLIAGKDMHSHE